jgi:hypothetical protein
MILSGINTGVVQSFLTNINYEGKENFWKMIRIPLPKKKSMPLSTRKGKPYLLTLFLR